MTDIQEQAAPDATRRVHLVLGVITFVGLIALGFTTYGQRDLQARWQSHLHAAGDIPAATPGQVVIRTVAIDRPYHWRVHIRGESYTPYLYACTGEFHSREMKAKDGFRCYSKEYDCEGYVDAPLFQVPGEAVVSMDVKLRPRSDGTWWAVIDYGPAELRGELFLDDVDGLNVNDIRIAGIDGVETFSAVAPLRLFDVVPERSESEPRAWLEGICCYLVPRDLSAPAKDCP